MENNIQEKESRSRLLKVLEKRGLFKLETVESQLGRAVVTEIRNLEKAETAEGKVGFLHFLKVSIDNFSELQEYGGGIFEDAILELISLLKEKLVRRDDIICFDANLRDYYIITAVGKSDEAKEIAIRLLKGINNYLFKCIAKVELEKLRERLGPLVKTDVEEEIRRRLEHIKNEYVKLTPDEEKKMREIVKPRAIEEKEKADRMFKDIVNAMQRDKYEEVVVKYGKDIKYSGLTASIGISLPGKIKGGKEFYEETQDTEFFKKLSGTMMESAAEACSNAQEKDGNCIFQRLGSVKIDGEYPFVQIEEDQN